MKLRIIILSSVLLVIISSCYSSKVFYDPPIQQTNTRTQYTRIYEDSFDRVWQKLINYTASNFFAIDKFEKDSGLLILKFHPATPEEYITGGKLKTEIRSIARDFIFEGDYVEYSRNYLNGSLNCYVNIFVEDLNNVQTKVTVNIRYTFSTVRYSENEAHNADFLFHSGECGTLRMKTNDKYESRTICPTYRAEKEILNAID